MIDIQAVMNPAPGSALAAFLTLSAMLAALSNEPKPGSLLAALQKVRTP